MSEDKSKGSQALKKLEIQSFIDNNFVKSTGNHFEMMVNPIDYTNKKGISYSNFTEVAGTAPAYKGYNSDILKFKFILDNTGAIPQKNNEEDLPQIITKLETTVYKFIGNSHEPPYLKIMWGNLNYNGRLKNMNVKYTMFSPDGEPIRAEVEISVYQYVDIETQEREKNTSSPDLSHLFLIKAGDTLPELCLRVYKSIDYMPEVARINGLKNFRKLIPGTKLLLPPLTDK